MGTENHNVLCRVVKLLNILSRNIEIVTKGKGR